MVIDTTNECRHANRDDWIQITGEVLEREGVLWSQWACSKCKEFFWATRDKKVTGDLTE